MSMCVHSNGNLPYLSWEYTSGRDKPRRGVAASQLVWCNELSHMPQRLPRSEPSIVGRSKWGKHEEFPSSCTVWMEHATPRKNWRTFFSMTCGTPSVPRMLCHASTCLCLWCIPGLRWCCCSYHTHNNRVPEKDLWWPYHFQAIVATIVPRSYASWLLIGIFEELCGVQHITEEIESISAATLHQVFHSRLCHFDLWKGACGDHF